MLVVSLTVGFSALQPAAAGDAEFAIGTKLADMLRASRGVVSANQSLINDADIGDKSFTGQKLLTDAEVGYLKSVGSPLRGLSPPRSPAW